MFKFKAIVLTILLFAACCAGGTVKAAFNLAGSTITQTGTDANLSGLAGVAGVTVSNQSDISVYNIGNRRLVIQGTLTIDPEREALIVGYNNGDLIQVTGNGHLIIGQEIVQNGFSRFSEGLAIYLEDTPLGFTNRFSFSNNASFTWNGGFISMYAGKFGFYGDGVTVRINSSNAKLLYRTQNEQNQIRQETDDFISQAFSFINGDLTIVGTGQQLNGYEPTHATGAIAFSSATPNVDVTLRGYSGGDRGNEKDIKLWSGGRPLLINSKTGSQLNVGAHIDGQNQSYGVARVFQELDLKTTDTLNNPIENATLYIRDTNHGGRETYTRENPAIDFTADNIYTASTDVNGDIMTQQILLAANVVNNGNGDAPNTGNYAWDYRGKNNDNSDLFDLHVWSYNHLYQVLSDVELKGSNGTRLVTKMLPDLAITESNRAAVAAYTGISINHANNTITIGAGETYNIRQLYDYVKYNKTLSANIEAPGIGTTAITSPDGKNFTSSYQIIIEGTLNIDPANEKLILASGTPLNALDVQSGGTLNLGVGGNVQVIETGLEVLLNGPGCCGNGGLTVRNGGTFNWQNARVFTTSVFDFQNGANVNITDAILEGNFANLRVRSSTPNLNINGFSASGIQYDLLTEVPTAFSGFSGENTGSLPLEIALGSGEKIIRDYSGGIGSAAGINTWQNQNVKAVNVEIGSEMVVVPDGGGQLGGRLYKEWDLTVQNLSNVVLPNIRWFIRDNDNGNRQTATIAGQDFSTDQVYTNVTNGSGQTGVQELLTAFYYRNNTTGDINGPDGNEVIDRRGNDNSINDNFTIHLWGYGYQYQPLIDNSMKGVGVLNLETRLFDDLNISEPDLAVVNAYTQIDSLDKLYDRAKAWKIEAANIEYPAINFQVMDGAGTQLNLGSKNLIIDNAAATPFAINTGTNTITIDANTMSCTNGNFRSLITTGLVTFANGASPGNCIFTDSVGTNGVLTLTGLNNANLLVYDDASVSDDTITYQTDVSGTIEIPFNATASTDYQVVVRREGYSEVNFEFDPSNGGFFNFPISQFRSLTIQGTPIYANTGNIARITMDFPNLRIDIGDFTIPAQEFYDTLQDYEVTEDGMKYPRIANYDGGDKVLLLNTYQMRSRDGLGTLPGVNGFIFAETGTVLDASNGSVQYLANDSATVDKQEQIIKMLEGLQGSAWDNNAESYAVTFGNLSDIIGTGFMSADDSLSTLIDSMLNRGILDVNTAKDLVR